MIITLFRWHLITENKHLSRDPQMSSVTRNCQIYSMQLDTLNRVVFFQIKRIPEFYDSLIGEIICWTINENLFLQTFVSKKHASLISLLTRNCQVHCIKQQTQAWANILTITGFITGQLYFHSGTFNKVCKPYAKSDYYFFEMQFKGIFNNFTCCVFRK